MSPLEDLKVYEAGSPDHFPLLYMKCKQFIISEIIGLLLHSGLTEWFDYQTGMDSIFYWFHILMRKMDMCWGREMKACCLGKYNGPRG